MPTLPIPFTSLDKSADKTGLSTWNQGQYNGYWSSYFSPDGPKMIWTKRPGLTEFLDLTDTAGIDGLHYWVRQDKLLSVCNGNVDLITEAAANTDITGTASMTAGAKPTFADMAGTSIYIASGGQIGAYAAAAGAYLTDTDAPTTVQFVATINQILVALRTSSERFDWAASGDPTDWGGDYSNTETKPDLAKAMITANNYLYFPGANTCEIWRDDGVTFVKEVQAAISRGTASGDSVIEINGVLYWLDQNREIIALNGFSVSVLSNPSLTRYLQSFTTVSDAIGMFISVGGSPFYILTFPSEKKTIVYDTVLNQFYEWSYWDANLAEHVAWKGISATHAPKWNKTFVGDIANGKIYEFTGTSDDGDDIRTVLQGDFYDRGEPNRVKFCEEITLIFKRADTATTPKQMEISWRDDGATDWTGMRVVDIEGQGKTEVTVNETRLGSYTTRMWRFVMSDATTSALVSATERFSFGR
jgi:hypothetical protein